MKIKTLPMKTLPLSAIILSACLVASSTVNAQPQQYPGYLLIYDNPDETITLTAHGIAGFTTINGTTYGTSTGTQTVPEGSVLTADIIWGFGFAYQGDKKIYFTEENNPNVVSDILTLHFLPQVYIYGNYPSHMTAMFQSGVDQPLSAFAIQPGDYVTSETVGTLTFSDNPGTSLDPGLGGYSTFGGAVYFPVAEVPEPTTLMLIPLGVCAVWLRRQSRTA